MQLTLKRFQAKLKYFVSDEVLADYAKGYYLGDALFTKELAEEINEQWAKEDPYEYGDPYGLLDHWSKASQSVWESSCQQSTIFPDSYPIR